LSQEITDAAMAICMTTWFSDTLSSSAWLEPNAPSLPIIPVSIAPPPMVSTTQEIMPECGK
jgi:hypothetical protein